MIEGISSTALAKAVDERVETTTTLVTEENVHTKLDNIVQDGDVILLQGAGNIGQLAAQFIDMPGDVT